MMKKESKCEELPNSKQYMCILIDEKKDIVYDKVSGQITGFRVGRYSTSQKFQFRSDRSHC